MGGGNDWVKLTTASIVGFMFLLFLWKLFWFLRKTRIRKLWKSAAAACHALFAEADESENSEIRHQSELRLACLRFQSARMVSSCLWLVALVAGIQLVLGDFTSSDTVANEEGRGPRLLIMILFAPAAMLPEKFLRNERLCMLLHALVMLNLCWLCSIPPTPEGRQFKSLISSFVAVSVAGLYPQFKWNVVPNICVTLSLIFSDVFLSTYPIKLVVMVSLELLSLLLRLGVIFCVIHLMKLSAKREVEASVGQCKQSAVSALLDMMCDVSIDLDERFLLKSHSQRLAGMLVHGPGRHQKGDSLLSFMPDEDDRTRFQAMLQSAHEPGAKGMPTPSSLIVQLRDSIGNTIKCVLFHVPYVNIGGQVHHLLGLREDAEFSNRDSFGELSSTSRREVPAGQLRPEIQKLLDEVACSSSSIGSSISDGGFCCRRKDATRQPGFEKPEVSQSMELYFKEPGLPIRWVAEPIREELALVSADETDLPHFGSLLPDNGERLASEIEKVIAKRQRKMREGNFGCCLGEWELSRTLAAPAQVSAAQKETIRRILWVNSCLPLQEENSFPYLTLSVTAAPPMQARSEGHGTAATSVAHTLIDLGADSGRQGTLAL